MRGSASGIGKEEPGILAAGQQRHMGVPPPPLPVVPESWTESVYPTALVSIAGFCRIEIFIHHDGALGAPARLERTTCWFEERVPETGPNRLSLPTGYGLGTDEEPSGMSVSELDNNSVPQRPTGANRPCVRQDIVTRCECSYGMWQVLPHNQLPAAWAEFAQVHKAVCCLESLSLLILLRDLAPSVSELPSVIRPDL